MRRSRSIACEKIPVTIIFQAITIGQIQECGDSLPSPLDKSLDIISNPVDEIRNRLSSNPRGSAVAHIFYGCVEVNILID